MLCCFDSPFSDPKSSYQQQVSTTGVSSYPGQRRQKIKTPEWGNSETDPLLPLSQQTCNSATNSDDLISVTVPPGVSHGETIHVRHPDKSGRLIEAQVPPGLAVGSIFYVRAPPKENDESSSNVVPLAPLASLAPPPHPFNKTSPGDFSQCLDTPQHNDRYERSRQASKPQYGDPLSPKSGNQDRYEFDRYLPTRLERNPPTAQPSRANVGEQPPRAPPGQNLVLVKIPPGMKAGSTLYVQIPDEPGRQLRAEVPSNVEEYFYVAYKPNDASTSARGTLQQQVRNQNNDGSNVLPIVGTLATGVAAAMAFGHFHHEN